MGGRPSQSFREFFHYWQQWTNDCQVAIGQRTPTPSIMCYVSRHLHVTIHHLYLIFTLTQGLLRCEDGMISSTSCDNHPVILASSLHGLYMVSATIHHPTMIPFLSFPPSFLFSPYITTSLLCIRFFQLFLWVTLLSPVGLQGSSLVYVQFYFLY